MASNSLPNPLANGDIEDGDVPPVTVDGDAAAPPPVPVATAKSNIAVRSTGATDRQQTTTHEPGRPISLARRISKPASPFSDLTRGSDDESGTFAHRRRSTPPSTSPQPPSQSSSMPSSSHGLSRHEFSLKMACAAQPPLPPQHLPSADVLLPDTAKVEAASTALWAATSKKRSLSNHDNHHASSDLMDTVEYNEEEEDEDEDGHHDHNLSHSHNHDHDHDDDSEEFDGENGQDEAATFRKRTEQSIAPFLTKHIAAQYANQNHEHPQTDRSNTKYCYRHRPDLKCRRAANEPSMEQLQNELATLPQADQQGISHVWSLFSAAPAKHRILMLQGLLAQCCFPQLSYISASVRELLKIDFISALPSELGLKILCYLDPTSLCKAACVSQKWKELADDDVVWHRMCEQHIDRKCAKCGWGLPLLDKYRLRMEKRQMQARAKGRQLANHERVSLSPAPQSVDVETHGSLETFEKGEGKRRFVEHALAAQSPSKRHCPPSPRSSDPSYFQPRRKPWKDVYRDRFRIGTNWKYGRYTLKTFKGHTNGVICLQYDGEVLASGSYDCTVKVWDMETGKELRTLKGHTLGVRCLQFDDSKLVSGGLDGKIKMWNMRTGELMRTMEGGEGGVIGLHLAGSILACGSADRTVKVWNFKTREDFVLHGHEDWVNSVKVDTASRTLFSGSDDCKVHLWDLDTRTIIKTFEGHVAQVQQVLPLASDFDYFDPDDASDASGPQLAERKSAADVRWTGYMTDSKNAERKPPPRYLLTAGLDSTIRLWDVWSGQTVRIFWGHLEGIWGLAADSLRVVSAANDCMVKVWDPRSGKCETTLTGHAGPVTCVGLSDRRMCTGSEDHHIRLYTFDT